MIVGGFPRDTGRGDIELTLRGIVDGHDGIERVASMGKYATCGRVYFIDNNAMWDFIKASKRKNFDFDGANNVRWFTVEKTDDERQKAARVSYLVNTVVDFISDKFKLTPPEARKRVDGDYTRGTSCI